MIRMNCQLHRKLRREWISLSAGAALLMLVGCSGEFNEQEGHREPRLGSYNVTLTPSSLPTVVPDAAKTPVSFPPIQLKVACQGDNLPSGCDQNAPNWKVQKPEGTAFLNVKIGDPAQPSTTADITVDVAAYLEQNRGDSSLGSRSFEIKFVPGSAPPKFRVAPASLTLTIASPAQMPARQEQASDKPRLAASTEKLYLFIHSVSDKSHSRQIQLTYSGPGTSLSALSISGPEAGQFSASAPSLPFDFDNGINSVFVTVGFQAAQEDLLPHQVTLTATTANGASVQVQVTGQRNNF